MARKPTQRAMQNKQAQDQQRVEQLSRELAVQMAKYEKLQAEVNQKRNETKQSGEERDNWDQEKSKFERDLALAQERADKLQREITANKKILEYTQKQTQQEKDKAEALSRELKSEKEKVCQNTL